MSAYITRIEAVMAQHSTSVDNKWVLIAAYRDSHYFTCALDNHDPCIRAFEVRNQETQEVLKVGSECIHRFGFDEQVLHMAEGMMKRVEKAVNKTRRQFIRSLGEARYNELEVKPVGKFKSVCDMLGKEVWATLTNEEKNVKLVEAYQTAQAMALITGVHNGTVLSEEETQRILDLGLGDKLAAAMGDSRNLQVTASKAEWNRMLEAQRLIGYAAKLTFADLQDRVTQVRALDADANIYDMVAAFDKYERDYIEYSVLHYEGFNPAIKTIQENFQKNGTLDGSQIQWLREQFLAEVKGPDGELVHVMTKLLDNPKIKADMGKTSILRAIKHFAETYKTIKPDQREMVRAIEHDLAVNAE
jgi:hypothetical protein